MQVQTNSLIIEGLDRIQEVLLRIKLADIRLPGEDIKIEFEQGIEYGRCSSDWYGGTIATVIFGESIFTLSAVGDMIADLVDKKNNEIVERVKDKGNGGRFYDCMKRYIKNDAHMQSIIEDADPKYRLEFDNNNWFEVFLDKINGKESNESVICDSINVFDAVAEVVENIPKWTKERE